MVLFGPVCIQSLLPRDVAEIIFLQLGMDWALAEEKVNKMVLGALGMAEINAGENHVRLSLNMIVFVWEGF